MTKFGMSKTWKSFLFGTALSLAIQSYATDYYVDAASGNDANAGTNQATALASIQAGVDACPEGGTVWISGGIYHLSAEITVEKAVTIQSLNGPAATMVDGGGSNRCFNLGGAACTLGGLTLTNGYTSGNGGGIYCSSTTPVITNCVVSGNSAKYGGGMYYGTANHCTFIGNTATHDGGGMRNGTVNHCAFTGNSAETGGGMYRGTANNCTFTENSANSGGGMRRGTANNCIISENSATDGGGGMYDGTANNCTFSGNSANDGGGMYNATANNCAFTGNSATGGGGMYDGTANSCTFSGNSANADGGGMFLGTANNCIVWYNTADGGGNDLYSTAAAYTCSPDVPHGENGCITNAPMLASSFHLAVGSPCGGAGSTNYLSGTDIDGAPWKNPPSMGCDEFSETVSGAIQLGFVNLAEQCVVGAALTIHLKIDGAASSSSLSFGNGQMVSNVLATTHSWNAAGEYDLVLSAFNSDYPDGLSITQRITVASGVDAAIYVAPGGDDALDGRSWATAKASIQAGVDEQTYYGGTVWLTNGTYSITSEVAVAQGIRIQSLNGPEATVVDGGGSTRCFNLGNAACSLDGLTITNGYTPDDGGGIYCSFATSMVTNCIITGNSANSGGGMRRGTANNCIISENSATAGGGGIRNGTANHCIITGNSAAGGGGMLWGSATHCTFTGNSAYDSGGGMFYGTANHCIVWYNTAGISGDNMHGTSAAYTCSPDVTHGDNGCITNAPMLLSSSHLAAGSPCIGAGSTNHLSGTDIDGDPWKSPPSMGCDEFSETVSGAIQLGFVNLPALCAAGPALPVQLKIDGAASSTTLSFGDGQMVSNVLATTHSWKTAGEYDVVLSAFNLDYPDGLSITQRITVVSAADAAVYVALDGDDAQDGRSWATAKATIQAGVDEQTYYGGTVWLANGTYSITSEVAVAQGIRIQSLNGPEATVVDGGGSTRCFNLSNAACTLDGLTITNGYTPDDGGGIYCSFTTPMVTNCVITGNSATYGGGMRAGTANHCIITGNSATYAGGGMYYSTAKHCTFSENSAHRLGGGMYNGMANHCTFIGNTAIDYGGGKYLGTANHCGFDGNSAKYGGGMADGTANHCAFTGNSASSGGGMYRRTANNCTFAENRAYDGGGMYSGTANHCTFTGNSATYGGGMGNSRYSISWEPPSTANHCTFTGNFAGHEGGGMYLGTANNCIVWYNMAGSSDDLYEATAIHTCSPGAIQGDNGCITNAPAFINRTAGDFRLAFASPCIDAGANAYASGSVDLDGNPRIVNGSVDMGAYEYNGALYDSDADGLVDDYEVSTGSSPVNANTDGDAMDDYEEYLADTGAADSNDWFRIDWASENIIVFNSSSNRYYTLYHSTNLAEGIWIPTDSGRMGTGGEDSMSASTNLPAGYFQLEVSLP